MVKKVEYRVVDKNLTIKRMHEHKDWLHNEVYLSDPNGAYTKKTSILIDTLDKALEEIKRTCNANLLYSENRKKTTCGHLNLSSCNTLFTNHSKLLVFLEDKIEKPKKLKQTQKRTTFTRDDYIEFKIWIEKTFVKPKDRKNFKNYDWQIIMETIDSTKRWNKFNFTKKQWAQKLYSHDAIVGGKSKVIKKVKAENKPELNTKSVEEKHDIRLTKTECWVASDGKLFVDKKEANEYQNDLIFKTWLLTQWIESDNKQTHDEFICDLLDWFKEDKVKKQLLKYYGTK